MKRYLLLSLFIVGSGLLAFMIVAGVQQPAHGSGREILPIFEGAGPAAPLDEITLSAVADAYVDSASPTTNYGSVTPLYVGSQTPSAIDRALFRFVLSSLPSGAIIDNATLRVYMSQAPSGPPLVVDIGAYRITSSWTETGVVWANQPSLLSIGKVTGVGLTLQTYDWEVTGLAQDWLANPATNFGVALCSETEGTVGWRGFASREAAAASRPQLVIEYHLPSCTDAQEPNDTFSQSFLITPTVEYLGCIPTPGDLDYFRFDVDPNTAIQVELYSLPANYDLYLYAPDQSLLDSSVNAGTTSEEVSHTTGPTGGQFYALVQSSGEWDLYNSYALKLTLTPVQPDTTPPIIISGPTVSSVTSTSATVSWTTDEASDSTVRFGRKADLFEGEETDSVLTQAHAVVLTGLQPSATYRYVVSSTDAASNTVTSREAFFTTGAVPGSQPPSISDVTLTHIPGKPIYYNIAASVPTGADIDRLEFYMDGELLGKVYAPLPDAPPGLFEFPLIPAALGISREEFFADHTIEAVAVDFGGLTGRFPVQFSPSYTCADIHVEMDFPYPDYTLYFDDGALPPGTIVPIEVYAWDVTEEECDVVPWQERAPCLWEAHQVERIDFAVRGTQICTFAGHENAYEVYTCDWDASDLGAGIYGIRVDVIDDEECVQTLFRDVTVLKGEPELDITREVTRHGSYFEVALTVRNRGHAAYNVDSIEDHVAGFQPIAKSADLAAGQHYEVTADCGTTGESCEVTLDVSSDALGAAIRLEGGDSLTLNYLAVPVLLPDPDAEVQAIGDEPVRVVGFNEADDPTFDRPCVDVADGTLLANAVYSATAESDYLIVTRPSTLFVLYSDDETNSLLSAMAELAQRKTGALGYAIGPDYVTREAIKDLIEEWGDTMRGSDGVGGHYLADDGNGGYLLIVGETGIIPSATLFDQDIADATANFRGGPVNPVSGVDNWYADIDNDLIPELVVARLIGSNAAALRTPIETSLLDQFECSRALVVSGLDNDPATQGVFENNADEIGVALRPTFPPENITVDHWGDYANDAAARIAFRNLALESDAIFYRNHGSATGWSSPLQTHDFPVDFGDSYPLVFGVACSTGHYQGTDSIAEAFLDSHAGVYIGATERSARTANNEAVLDYIHRWLGDDATSGMALRETKRGLVEGDPDSGTKQLWVMEYNLYGDAKYAMCSAGVGNAASSAMRPTVDPSSSLDVTVPDYQVTSADGVDTARIPGGSMLLEPGLPIIPIYVVTQGYPKGYRVQEVTLTAREGMTTSSGLNLPLASDEQASDSASAPNQSTQSVPGWYPQKDFAWEVDEHLDGTTTLIIRMYPFYYDAATTDVQFYKNYHFDIRTTSSTIELVGLATDKQVYQQGEPVAVGMVISGTNSAQDVIVEAVIRRYGSSELVDGLLLRSLADIQGLTTFSTQWNSAERGLYYAEVTLRDEAGDVLDRKTAQFTVGIASGEITTFTVTPGPLDIGEQVAMSLTFANMGTVPLTGTVVVQIQTEAGEMVREFSHDYGDLTPGNDVSFADVWDTSQATVGSYRVVAYVLYESTATEPSIASVRIGHPLYLPFIRKNFGGQ